MGFLSKLGIGIGSISRGVSHPIQANNRLRTPGSLPLAAGTPRAPELQETTRISNGLKEFLWNLDDAGHRLGILH